MLHQYWSPVEASNPFLEKVGTLGEIRGIWGQVAPLRRLPHCCVMEKSSVSGSLRSQIPDPPILIYMFLGGSLIFVRLSFPICEMMIMAFIGRSGSKGTKQALPQGRSSRWDCRILSLPVWLPGTGNSSHWAFQEVVKTDSSLQENTGISWLFSIRTW